MRIVAGFLLLVGILLAPGAGRAAVQPYQGIYTIIDPYFGPDLQLLKAAANTTCASQSAGVTTPFCGATNGILLRTNWCDFALYHVSSAEGTAYPSCHYGVSFTGGGTSASVEVVDPGETSPCKGKYDTCSGKQQSILGSTLALIQQIDQQRATAGFAPLKISIGLSAGGKTPQSVLDAVGYVDVPFSSSSAGVASLTQCLRMPLPWSAAYTSDFNHALDEFVAYVQAQLGADAAITIVKIAAMSGDTLEVEEPGAAMARLSPTDPGDAGPGPALGCSSTVPPGQTWLDAYNAAPVAHYTLAQANEHAFGTVIGHMSATLANDGISALLSLPTTNGAAFPMVNCGTDGSTACVVAPSTGDWTVYYMERYVDDLFDGGLSGQAAQTAYAKARSGTFSLSPSQFSVNWTGVSSVPLVASGQSTCVLNNTATANAPVENLGGQHIQVDGVGTVIGWQSQTDQGDTCSTGGYKTMLNNALNNGGTFIEIEDDAAFTDISACSAPLKNALSSILKVVAPGECQF